MTDRPSEHQVPASLVEGAPAAGDDLPPAPAPTHAERCRTLVASATRASLCTLAVEPEGYPYGSVATFALDRRGDPLLLLSRMAEHTKNALRDPRASLLVAEPVPEGTDPLARGRATPLGPLAEVAADDVPDVRAAYLAANPTAAYYADFGDFAFFRLTVEAIRYVGGYGRMSWVDAAAYAAAEADPLALAGVADGIVEHMNADHAEAQVLLCRHLGGRPATTAATMSAVDRYGFEMIAEEPGGRTAVRLGFEAPCSTGEEVRRAVVAMVGEARRRASHGGGPTGG